MGSADTSIPRLQLQEGRIQMVNIKMEDRT